MAKTSKPKKLVGKSKEDEPVGWVKILLTLTLVPMVVGILMIGAWALDIELWDDPQAQLFIGLLFILLSFTLSNALQKRWRLAVGWGFLVISDLILLLWMNVTIQVIALILAAIGLLIIILEFARHWKKE